MLRMSAEVARMALAVRQAGMVARRLQGRVVNEGKFDATQLPNDDDRLRSSRAAKTVVDELAQDILILAAAEILNTHHTVLDAEENTAAAGLFSTGASNTVLVLDPVDGTVEYLEGRDSYSVCAGLIDGERLKWAIVLFPARDRIYLLDETGHSWFGGDALLGDSGSLQPLQGRGDLERQRIFVNGRVPAEIQDCLRAGGFRVLEDTHEGMGAPDCILSCLDTTVAYVSHTRQARDVLLGGILGGVDGAYAVDWTGAPLSWPAGGRVPRAVFGWGTYDERLSRCLSPSGRSHR